MSLSPTSGDVRRDFASNILATNLDFAQMFLLSVSFATSAQHHLSVIIPQSTKGKHSICKDVACCPRTTSPSLVKMMVHLLRSGLSTPRTDAPAVDVLNPYDARVLAVVDHPVGGKEENGYGVMSSPNAVWVLELKWGTRSVYQRRDGRFGYEDRALWPQYYCSCFEYICCIPRQPEDPNKPISILWWNPESKDLIPIAGSSVHLPSLGELAPGPREKLAKWRDKLIAEVKHYQTSHVRNTLLGLLETSMQHAWLRLTLSPMTQKHMVENVPEFQRYCLDIWALLDYLLIYSPRLTYPDSDLSNLPVAHHLMGAVTESDKIVMQLFKMKIPVWHVRNSLYISPRINIQEIVHFSAPHNMVLLPYPGEPFKIVCSEPPGTTCLQATQRLGCVVLELRTGISSVEGDANDLSGPQRSSANNKPPRPAPYPPRPPVIPEVPLGSGPSNLSTKAKKPTTQASRDTFRDVDAPYMPPAVEVWASALSSVLRMVKPTGSVRLGYTFPDANLIAGSNANDGHYLVTWLSRCAACIYKQTNTHFALFSPSSQDWRSFLSNTLKVPLDASEMPSPTAQALVSGNSKSISTAQRRKQSASKFFADMSLQEAIPETVYWQEHAISTGNIKSLRDSLNPQITTEVLWDLFEHNFRFELLALDCLLNPAAWCHAEKHKDRDMLLRSLFFDDAGQPGGFYLFQDIPRENSGLAADQWQTRRPFVENLMNVMVTWPHAPLLLLSWSVGVLEATLETKFLDFEREVAQLYCQVFYNTFGRAANVPHRIKPYLLPTLASG